jgi:hypothetical protein
VEVLDFEGACRVECDDELLARLQSVRRNADGAFILHHHGGDESLWVHINGDAAFLWFFPNRNGGHPGFVTDGMWAGEQRDVRFLLVGGDEGSAIWVPWWQLVPVNVAYWAAVEFLQAAPLPQSVRWLEL